LGVPLPQATHSSATAQPPVTVQLQNKTVAPLLIHGYVT
jgi:hypothetical protein